MAASFQLEIVTPTAVIDCGQVESLRAPGRDGLFGVQARHTRTMSALRVGEVKVVTEGKNRYYATGPGYADIQGQSVQLLVESAEEAHSIDAARAHAAEERARLHLKQKTEFDAARSESALVRALNRLLVAERG